MYSVGELIVYGGTGVCEVEAVETKGERQFYRLRPLYQSGIISVPVDGKVFMRPVISREEAEAMRRAAKRRWDEGYCSASLLPKLFPGQA